MTSTLGRYFARRFLAAALAVFVGIFLLVVLVDYIELTRRSSSIPNVSNWTVATMSLFRVPQITERLLPFSVLVGGMVAYLNLSRRNELVIARAAGLSAWQFVAPAVVTAFFMGLVGAAAYNPLAAYLAERANALEQRIFGARTQSSGGFWVRQRSGDGQAILFAASSKAQGEGLAGVSAFVFDANGAFLERVEADSAELGDGHWRIDQARIYRTAVAPRLVASYLLPTDLTLAQVRQSFATPDTVPFWKLSDYIELVERAGLVASGYRLQYQLLLARPFLLAAMVLLAASVSLRFFRSGGVQRMVIVGVCTGFLLYVMSKVTEDLSKAGLMHAVAAAWAPVLTGALIGTMALLYQEDG